MFKQKFKLVLAAVAVSLMTACASIPEESGSNWKMIESHKGDAPFDVAVRATVPSGGTIPLDRTITLNVNSAAKGRLFVFSIDASDRIDMIFPSERSPRNGIEADVSYQVPPVKASWEFAIAEPVGPLMVVTVVAKPGSPLDEIDVGAKSSGIATALSAALKSNSVAMVTKTYKVVAKEK